MIAMLGLQAALAIEVGAAAPPIDLAAHASAPATLDLQGKVVFLNFWASWCAPCRAELPLLDALHDELDPATSLVLAVNIDHATKLGERVVSRLSLDLPVVWDPETKLAAAYDPPKMPTSYLLSAEGTVVEVFSGELKASDMAAVKAKIEAAVAQ